MTTVAGLPSGRPRAASPLPLKVSPYENVASMLLALLILIGVVVFCLLIAWLSIKMFFPPFKSIPVRLEQVSGGMESGVVGESMQLDSPSPQDIAQESDLVEPQFQEALAAVIDAVATRQADLDDPALTEQLEEFQGGGRQEGAGDQPGFGAGEGPPGVPPHMRWEVHFDQGTTLEGYARILQHFGIELGVLGGANEVLYAYNVAQPTPDRRSGPRTEERRLYMSWRQGELKEADRELLTRAGVAAGGKVILQFYPDHVEQMLLQLERSFRGRDASEIRKTRFGIRQAASGFEFYVIDQAYL
ncbi:MAG: hypothetical protein WD847_16405 [Pirellulales bacterium]